MATITNLKAREILDSRGNPTVEVDATLSDGSFGRASVPSGASTGAHEMLELRDEDNPRYGGKGVLKAVRNVNEVILPKVQGMDATRQNELDQTMIALDNTPNKGNLGANAILGVSLAVMRAAAESRKLPLFRYVGEIYGNDTFELPQVMFNVLNGGKHANWATDVQEFFISPTVSSMPVYADRLRAGAEIYHMLGKLLKAQKYTTSVGDEGGYAAKEMTSNTEPFDMLMQAIEKAGYTPGKDVVLGCDAASTEFFENGKYILRKEGKELTSSEWIALFNTWTQKYPIVLMEDMLSEDDWTGWQEQTALMGDRMELVGDDLLVTNPAHVRKAIELKACNSVLIKFNQIGSVSESFETIKLAHANGWQTLFSHRSGETEDSTLADLVVGTRGGKIKTGAPARSERMAKYNQLLRIEEMLRG